MPSNPVSIREYLEAKIQNLQERMGARFTGLEEKFEKLETVVIKHLEAPNPSSQDKEETDKRLAHMEGKQANLEGRMWGLAAAFTVIVAVVNITIKLLMH